MARKNTWAEVAQMLAQRRARFHKWSAQREAVYFSPTTGKYIKAARRSDGGYEVTEHATCPCG